MNKKRLLQGFFYILSAIIIFSCENRTNYAAINKTARGRKENKYHFSLNVSKGAKYYYAISNETITELQINDENIESRNESTVGLFYEVLSNSHDSILLKITYDKFHIVFKNDDETQVIDADNAEVSGDPTEKLLGNVKGSSLFLTLNKTGKILNISGNKEIINKVLNGLGIYDDEQTKKQVNVQLSKLVGDDFVQNNLQPGFNFFPDTAVHIGDSWSRKETQSAEFKYGVAAKYVLTSIEDDVAEINVSSVINNESSPNTSMMGYNVISDITGKQEGDLEMNILTGMLSNAVSNTALDGTIQVSGKIVPISIKIKKEILVKKQ